MLVMSPDTLAIVNDNNYPLSIGRHAGQKLRDDNELSFVKLPKKVYRARKRAVCAKVCGPLVASLLRVSAVERDSLPPSLLRSRR